jgi:hypothetical protein
VKTENINENTMDHPKYKKPLAVSFISNFLAKNTIEYRKMYTPAKALAKKDFHTHL